MTDNNNGIQELVSAVDDIAKLLAHLVTKESETQAEAILSLDELGFDRARIATLLGAKADTVYRSLRRAGRLD